MSASCSRARPARERVLPASAQGLIHRGAKAGDAEGIKRALWLTNREDPLRDRFAKDTKLGALKKITPSQALGLGGQRRAVIVDADLPVALNLATMVAAAEGFLVAYPGLVEEYRLQAAFDLRGVFDTEAEALDWARENVAPGLDRGLLAVVPDEPTCSGAKRKLVVTSRML